MPSFKDIVKGASDIFTPIIGSATSALASRDAVKYEEDALKKRIEVTDAIMRRAKAEKDEKKRKALTALATRTAQDEGVVARVKEFQETPLQTAAKAAMTLGTVASFGQAPAVLGFAKAKPVADFIAGAGGVAKVTKTAKALNTIKNLGKAGVVGSLWGAAGAMQEGKTNPKEIAKDMAEMGVFNALFPIVAGGVAKGGLMAGKKLGRVSADLIDTGIGKLEQYADGKMPEFANGLEKLRFVARSKGEVESKVQDMARMAAVFGRGVQATPGKMKRKWLDYLAPLDDVSAATMKILGKELDIKADPYKQARAMNDKKKNLFYQYTGQGNIDTTQADDFLQKGLIDEAQHKELYRAKESGELFQSLNNDYEDIKDDVRAYIQGHDFLDRFKKGEKSMALNTTREETEQALALLEGVDYSDKLKEAKQKYDRLNELKYEILKEGGVADDVLIDKFKKENPNYVGHQVMDFFSPDTPGTVKHGEALPDVAEFATEAERKSKQGANRGASIKNVFKKAHGSTREILDPLEAQVVAFKQAIDNAVTNKTQNTMRKALLENGIGDEFGFSMLINPEHVKERRSILSTIKNLYRSKEDGIIAQRKEASKIPGQLKEAGKKIENLYEDVVSPAVAKKFSLLDDVQNKGAVMVDKAKAKIASGISSVEGAVDKKFNSKIKKLAGRQESLYSQFEEIISAIEEAAPTEEISPEVNLLLKKAANVENKILSITGDLNTALEQASLSSQKATERGERLMGLGQKAEKKATDYVEGKKKEAFEALGEMNKRRDEKSEKIKETMKGLNSRRQELERALTEKKEIVNSLKERMKEIKDVKEKVSDLEAKGLGVIHGYVDGTPTTWTVRKDIADAMKNATIPETGLLLKLASIPAKLVKTTATTLSLPFLAKNPMRDVATGDIIAKHGLSGADWIKTLLSAKRKDSTLYDAYQASGGVSTGMYEVAQRTPKEVLKATKRFKPLVEKAGDYINPIKVVENLGSWAEETTRLAVYKQALKKGMTIEEAAWEARNATIDFSKMGSSMMVANKLIPFLNARVQGLANVAGAAAKDPTAFIRKQLYHAVYPAMLLSKHNNQYESYRNIDQRTKDANFIIMLGEEDGLDDGGNPIKIPNAVRIPKSEAVSPIANTMEHFLDQLKGRDVREYDDLLRDILESASPISDTSALGPLTLPFELAANYSYYEDKPITPEYIKAGSKYVPTKDIPENEQWRKIKKGTSDVAQLVGKQFNMAPTKIDHVMSKLFTSVYKDISSLANYEIETDVEEQAKEQAEKMGVPVDEAIDAQKSSFQRFAETPVLRGFLTTNTFGAMIKDLADISEIKGEKAMEKYELGTKAEIIKNVLNRMDKQEANEEWSKLKKEDKELADEVRKAKEAEKNGMNISERSMQSLGVEDGSRAEFIYKKIMSLPTDEMRRDYYNQLREKGIITKDVGKQIKKLKTSGEKKESGE